MYECRILENKNKKTNIFIDISPPKKTMKELKY